jgi:hypothetical protein
MSTLPTEEKNIMVNKISNIGVLLMAIGVGFCIIGTILYGSRPEQQFHILSFIIGLFCVSGGSCVVVYPHTIYTILQEA